jgi:hypothetical protein
MPDLTPVESTARAADYTPCEAAVAVPIPCPSPSLFYLILYEIVDFWRNDRGMAVFHIVHRHLALVDLDLLYQEVHRKGLLQERDAFVFFVDQDTLRRAD